MNELLTSKQIQEILKVDRITIYRMLQDGRLKGIKIGQQWRFPQSEVNRLLGQKDTETENPLAGSDSDFPIHCMQTIQDLFSDVSHIPALIVNMEGEPLTKQSNPCAFCQAITASSSGSSACRESWRSFAQHSKDGSKFFSCHAGLQYVGAPIKDKSGQVGLFLIGQFNWQEPDSREETERIRRLSASIGISADSLQESAEKIKVIPPEQHSQVESWPFTAARAVNSILNERVSFMERLKQIANLTQIP